MNEFLQDSTTQLAAATALVVLLLLAGWLVIRFRKGGPSFEKIVDDIAYDRLSDFVLPKADEGEIHIDHLLLTAQGLLVLDVKQVHGVVFGSDKMQEWTVIGASRRYTFPNPQPALYDRIAAVKQVARQVPVTGRLVFFEGADFSKGVPKLACRPQDLTTEFGDTDRTGAASRIDAFKPQWETLKRAARQSADFSQRRGRASVLRS